MKTEMHNELVAIEDASLETVAGGYSLGEGYDWKSALKFDANFQNIEVVFAQNTILSAGDVDIDIDASNDNG